MRYQYYRWLWIILLFFTGVCQMYAQSARLNQKQYWYIEPKFQYGRPLQYSDSLSTCLEQPFTTLDIRLGKYFGNAYPQSYYYHMPHWGIGFYLPNYKNDTIGNPYAIYAYYQGAFSEQNRFAFNWDVSLGLGWHFNEYHPQYNPRNDLLGSDKNAYFALSFLLTYHLTPPLQVVAGFRFSHFSNAALNQPNKGFNMYGVDLGIRYHLSKNPDHANWYKPDLHPQDHLLKRHEFSVAVANGLKTFAEDLVQEPLYYTSSLSVAYMYRYHWLGAIGVGIDYLYDASIERWHPRGHRGYVYHSMLGIVLKHELDAGSVSMLTEIGTYIWKAVESKGPIYFRVGLKKNIYHNLYATFGLKTLAGFKADYCELGIGYQVNKGL